MSKNPIAVRESRFKRMLYSHAAGVVLAQFERDDDARHVRSLYIRDPETFEYERLDAPDDRTSYDSPVVARSVPFTFFSVMLINDTGGGNWGHLARANIVTRQIETVFTPSDLIALTKVDRNWPCHPWVSALHDVSDDGSILTCTVGLPEPRDGGAFRMNYSLFTLELGSHRLTHLADLSGTTAW